MKARRIRQLEARAVRRKAYSMDLEPPLRFAVQMTHDGSFAWIDYPTLIRSGPESFKRSAVMGTHETLQHALGRLGWS